MSNSTESEREPLQILVNGTYHEIPPALTVVTLLDWLNVQPDRVAIELNKSIVRKRDWALTSIEAGAHLEIVEFVGGG